MMPVGSCPRTALRSETCWSRSLGRRSYFQGEDPSAFTDDGWFHTGDVCTIDPRGYMTITDRSKDVIKSGGEWISSIDLENVAMGHPAVQEAAVIGIVHPQWDERPLLVVVRRPDSKITREELLNSFEEGRKVVDSG